MTPTSPALVEVARGVAPADLVLANAHVVDVFAGSVVLTDVALLGDRIVGIGRNFQSLQTIDLRGRHLLPGFVDARASLEASHLAPAEYAKMAIAHGTTTAVIELADIASVCGVKGVTELLEAVEGVEIDFLFSLPHVQVDPRLATVGASINQQAMTVLDEVPKRVGYGGYLDCAALIQPDQEARSPLFRSNSLPLTGSAPGLLGSDLQAYSAIGITGDDHWLSMEEAEEKLRAGIWLLAYESSTSSMLTFLPAQARRGDTHRLCLVSGSKSPRELSETGFVDSSLRAAVRAGTSGIQAVRGATLSPATYLHLSQRGGIAPGYVADLVAVDDLSHFQVEMVVRHGKIVEHRGRSLAKGSHKQRISVGAASIRARPPRPQDFNVVGRPGYLRVIGVAVNDPFTEVRWELATTQDGCIVADPSRGILKVAALERHRSTGRMGLGFASGLGFNRGAVCTSFAPPAHPLVVVGADDQDMASAVQRVMEMQGGIAVVVDGAVLESLPLPVAGLLTTASAEDVAGRFHRLEEVCRQLGSHHSRPIHAVAALADLHLPALRLGDQGLIDVENGAIVALQESN